MSKFFSLSALAGKHDDDESRKPTRPDELHDPSHVAADASSPESEPPPREVSAERVREIFRARDLYRLDEVLPGEAEAGHPSERGHESTGETGSPEPSAVVESAEAPVADDVTADAGEAAEQMTDTAEPGDQSADVPVSDEAIDAPSTAREPGVDGGSVVDEGAEVQSDDDDHPEDAPVSPSEETSPTSQAEALANVLDTEPETEPEPKDAPSSVEEDPWPPPVVPTANQRAAEHPQEAAGGTLTAPLIKVILDSIADGVFTVDADWRIMSFSKAAERITGVAVALAIGQKCSDVFRSDACESACVLREMFRSHQPVLRRRMTIVNAGGTRVPVSVTTAALRDAQGDATGALVTFHDLSEIERLEQKLRQENMFGEIITKNHELLGVLDILPDIAESESPVMIQGSVGSGKELFAKAIHRLSARRDNRFVAVNCAALPEGLLESELFGKVREDAPTPGAAKPGRFAWAEGGTLYLDDIGALPIPTQAKLLRVIDEGEYQPMGASDPVKADVRIIAATSRNIAALVDSGTFREGLFYRINVVRLSIPPLKRHREDIPLLIDAFMHELNVDMEKNIRSLSADALAAVMRYDFPGNVRELHNAMEHAFVLCRGEEIGLQHLPPELSGPRASSAAVSVALGTNPLRQAENEAIRESLERHGGHRAKVAAELGIDKSTLWRKMKRYAITYP